jgi:hypothetical protein
MRGTYIKYCMSLSDLRSGLGPRLGVINCPLRPHSGHWTRPWLITPVALGQYRPRYSMAAVLTLVSLVTLVPSIILAQAPLRRWKQALRSKNMQEFVVCSLSTFIHDILSHNIVNSPIHSPDTKAAMPRQTPYSHHCPFSHGAYLMRFVSGSI